MATEFTNTKYSNLTYNQHVRLRTGMYVGSKEITENNIWIINKDTNKLEKKVLKFSIALYNIIDEIIVNSIDHIHRCVYIKGKNKCDTIKLNFDIETGIISVYNNGEGIIVEKHGDNDYYIPEMIFSKEMSGSNFSTDDSEKISAGMNGSGAKITNILSKIFEIETSDLKNKLHYYQKFENGNEIKNAPIITKLSNVDKEKKDPFTKVTFLLEYELFDIKGYNEEIANILEQLLYTRMNYVSIYCQSKYKIYYNDELITKHSLYDLSKLLIDDEDIIKCQLYNKNDKKLNAFDINICIYDCQDGQEHISFINGLLVSNGGSHLQYINKLILDNLKSKLEKKLKDKIKITNKIISNYLFIFFSGNITNPDYKNQSKTELSVSLSRFKDYVFDDKIYKQLWSKLETKIDEIYLDKISKENISKKTSKLRGIKKYRSADKAGTNESYKCSLFIPEGDSAESCIKNGLTTNKDLGYKYYGIFNIQGVPLNVRKEIDIKEIKKNDKITYIIDRKKKILDNERFTSLVKVLNLNYSYNYEMDAKGDEEFKTLRYAKVLIAVDADIDGLGAINGLILNFFNVFFPNLMLRKMFQIFYTPLIRAYPTKKGKFIEEFYNVEDYDLWCNKNNINDYKINYIKGLATHSNMEIKQMFKKIDNHIYTYELDDKANEYFEIYFGEDSDKRKKILASGDKYKEDHFKEKYTNKVLTCSYQLNVNTKEFQLDNIQRKMPHIIDGLNPARRKILAGSLNKFRQSNNKIKVFQLGGYIAEKMFYHHGSDSLNKTIINMAQDFPGSRNIPLLLPIGQFGSRLGGSKDAGSPRYIDTKLNKAITDLLFPHIDDNLLEYHIIDGEIGEPKYFIPVIPLVLLEDVCLPSTGWKIELYARDLNQVIDNVKSIIKNDNCKVKNMKYFKNKFKGREILNKNYNMLIGNYEIPEKTKDQVLITELPPRVWNENFIEALEKKDFIDDIIDESSIYDVKIKVLFKKGELNRLQIEYEAKNEHLNYIEYNLKLYSKLSHCINLYTQKNTVMEFTNYTDIMIHWYVVRKECYFKRIEREIIILKYKIIINESIIRFIENHDSYQISKKSDCVAIQILESNDYRMLNKSTIDSPGLIKNEDLENYIININQSYDYLLNLSYRKMNSESYERYNSNLEELKKKLEYYNKPDIYKIIWIEEINKLCKALENGLKNGFYQEDPNLFKK
jgi:DNA gyrase/topoisomerase IV subunit B